MPNRTLAKEWLVKAYHDLSSAEVLYGANHFTDSIGFDLQQSIEKSLKSLLAFNNNKIKKTHDLTEISALVVEHIQFENSEIDLLDIATGYCLRSRYPAGNADLPSRKEIKEVLDFTTNLLERVCRILKIDKHDVMR